MNIARQIWHVMKKDLRQAWLPLIALAPLVLIAMTREHLDSIIAFTAASEAIVVFAPLLAAMIVQQDSAVRPRAYWSTIPLHPLAVFAAKLVVVGVFVIGGVLGAQAVALRAAGVPLAAIPSYVHDSLWAYVVLIAGGVVLGALTPNLKSLLLADIVLIAISFAVRGSFGVFASAHGLFFHEQRNVLAVLVGASACTVLAYAYRRRATRRPLLVGVAGLILMFGSPYLQAALNAPAFLAPPPSAVRRVTLKVDSTQVFGIGVNNVRYSRLQAALQVGGDAGSQQLALLALQCTVRHPDGSTARAPLTLRPLMLTAEPATEERVVGLADTPVKRRPSLAVDFVSAANVTRDRLQAPGSRVTIDGLIVVYHADSSIATSTAMDAEHRIHDLTYTLHNAPVDSAQTWRVLIRGVTHPYGVYDSTEYWLVNATRKERLQLTQWSGNGENEELIVAGARKVSGTVHVSTRTLTGNFSSDAAPSDPGWYRDARLLVVHWIPQYSYPVHVEYTIPR